MITVKLRKMMLAFGAVLQKMPELDKKLKAGGKKNVTNINFYTVLLPGLSH